VKILLLNPNYIHRNNWGHQLFKNEFSKHHDVTCYGDGFPGYKKSLTVPEILKKLNKEFDKTILAKAAKVAKDVKVELTNEEIAKRLKDILVKPIERG